MKDGFKSLIVWQKAMELARIVYDITKELPPAELYSLVSQMRRAAVSVPSNIAEGSRRSTKKDYVQFLRIAHGSLAELETQLLLARTMYPDLITEQAEGILEEISKMLSGLIAKLKSPRCNLSPTICNLFLWPKTTTTFLE